MEYLKPSICLLKEKIKDFGFGKHKKTYCRTCNLIIVLYKNIHRYCQKCVDNKDNYKINNNLLYSQIGNDPDLRINKDPNNNNKTKKTSNSFSPNILSGEISTSSSMKDNNDNQNNKNNNPKGKNTLTNNHNESSLNFNSKTDLKINNNCNNTDNSDFSGESDQDDFFFQFCGNKTTKNALNSTSLQEEEIEDYFMKFPKRTEGTNSRSNALSIISDSNSIDASLHESSTDDYSQYYFFDFSKKDEVLKRICESETPNKTAVYSDAEENNEVNDDRPNNKQYWD